MIPLDTRSLFPLEREALRDLLLSLQPAEWQRPTVCPGWNVADVTAHVVNDHVRRISGSRDGHAGAVFDDGETLPAYLSRVNGEFVAAMRQCSPRLMIELLAQLGVELDKVWETTELDGPADLNVSWAGDGVSPAWLDIARDYTEFWMHHQQIRDAVGRPGADGVVLMRPVVCTVLHALPVALRNQVRPAGTAVAFVVDGVAGGSWSAVSDGAEWNLTVDTVDSPAASVRMDQDTLWRLAGRGITVTEARHRSQCSGDGDLAQAATTLLAIVD